MVFILACRRSNEYHVIFASRSISVLTLSMAPERSSTSSTMVSSPYYHCLTFSLLLIPPLIFASYLLAAFPNPPETLNVHPSLASLPLDAKSWRIYPEDYYEGGAYVNFPYGRVRYWIMGPENGKKVRR